MLGLLHYVDGDLGDPATYQAMSDAIGDGKKVLFYLEVPPPLFGRIAEGISKAGRAEGNRIMVEKPFGTDLDSAEQLNELMHQYFPEDAIYRVDHWLGLDPVDNLMFLRFANSIVEPLLNRTYVQSIQITMGEAFDVADRGSFYDKTGATRDVVQNHMLQVLATVLADPPDGSGLDTWRDAKSRLIGALAPLDTSTAVRGQYEGYHDVAGRGPRQHHRDLRGHPHRRRLLALGGRAHPDPGRASACRSPRRRCRSGSGGRRTTCSASATPPRPITCGCGSTPTTRSRCP